VTKKKKICKANKRKRKVKGGKDEKESGQGGRGVPRSHTGPKRREGRVRGGRAEDGDR